MKIPMIEFQSYEGWNDEVGSRFIRETNDIVQVQNNHAEIISGKFLDAEKLINNKITHNSFKANIDALRPPK